MPVLSPRAIIAAALACLFLANAGFADPPREVVFAAWNVRNYLRQPAKNAAGRVTTPPKDPDSVDAVVRTLREIKPDIIGLCEIGSRRDLADLQRRLQLAGLSLPYRTWVDGPDRERHIALLSRFPLRTQHDTRTAFLLDGLPRRVQRGIMDCNIRVRPDFTLRVLGVHLKSPRVVPEFDATAFRRAESLILRRRIETIHAETPDLPLLVFGDFNDTKNSPAVKGVLGRAGTMASLTALPLADRQGDQWTYRWDESDEYSRIDYVMVNRVLRPLVRRGGTRIFRDKKWFEASDHRPLVVTLHIPGSRPKR